MIQQIEPKVEMPSIRYEGVAYPVLFAAASVKRWAEHRGIPFVEAVVGWEPLSLTEEDLICMLRITLEAGERRRRLFTTEENHVITDELIAAMMETYHVQELWDILIAAWSTSPGREPDPPPATVSSAGETSSD